MSDEETPKQRRVRQAGELTDYDDLPNNGIQTPGVAEIIESFRNMPDRNRLTVYSPAPDPKDAIAREQLDTAQSTKETLEQLAALTLDNVELSRAAVAATEAANLASKSANQFSKRVSIASIVIAGTSVAIAVTSLAVAIVK